jgi:hypothetical protein
MAILNGDGSPNPKNWGLREMQICAHYLRALPMSDLEDTASDPPVIQAVSATDRQGKKRLAYRIYLQKPRLCAIVPARPFESQGRADLRRSLAPKGMILLSSCPDLSDLKGYAFVVFEQGPDTCWTLGEDGKSPALKVSNRPFSRIDLPVRTLLVEKEFLDEFLDSASRTEQSVDTLLEPLHQLIWKKYRDARPEWKEKPVRALAGWEEKSSIWVPDSPDDLFCHAQITPQDKPHRGSPYLVFGDTIYAEEKIGCAWIDHISNAHFSENKTPKVICAAAPIDDAPQPFIFAEVLDSQSPHRSSLVKQAEGRMIGDELIAAAMSRVVILDERVQNEIARQYRKVDYALLWPCMGLWVPLVSDNTGLDNPPPTTDLNRPDFEGIREFLKRPARMPEQFPPDFFVLHLSILETLKKSLPDKSEADTLEALLEGTQIGPDCEIVIVTGRGVPAVSRHYQDTRPLKVRFLPVSTILEYILARPSKLALMRALWSAAASG